MKSSVGYNGIGETFRMHAQPAVTSDYLFIVEFTIGKTIKH